MCLRPAAAKLQWSKTEVAEGAGKLTEGVFYLPVTDILFYGKFRSLFVFGSAVETRSF